MDKPGTLIKNKIHTIRGVQVMLDSDLAELYGVEVKALNQAVKRNRERFPEHFMFQLSQNELKILRSQFVTSSHGGRRYNPFVFTEQGVSMISAILKSKTAVQVSIRIIDAFVEMRQFLIKNAYVFQEFQRINQKLTAHDEQLEQVFKAMDNKKLPQQGIFFNGQVFDAFVFISKLIKTAEKCIVLIDNYVDEYTLQLFSDKNSAVSLHIYTRHINQKLLLAKEKFNRQYGLLEIARFDDSHDRFMIIDDEIYHIGASLKDLGKKWFAFSKLGFDPEVIMSRITAEQ